jgi:chromosome segregation protein
VILVTHQKRTMEAADVLYGVSMGRDGASRVVAQRIAEAIPEAAR